MPKYKVSFRKEIKGTVTITADDADAAKLYAQTHPSRMPTVNTDETATVIVTHVAKVKEPKTEQDDPVAILREAADEFVTGLTDAMVDAVKLIKKELKKR